MDRFIDEWFAPIVAGLLVGYFVMAPVKIFLDGLFH